MKRLATLSCLLFCLAAHQARGQTEVVITAAEPAGSNVAGGGKAEIDKKDVPLGVKIYLRDKKTGAELPGFVNLVAPLKSDTISFWTATWDSVPVGEYEMFAVLRVLRDGKTQDFKSKREVTVKKTKTAS